MSWLTQRAHLTPELEERRRTEERRERLVQVLKPAAVAGSVALGTASVAFAAVLAIGASHAGHPVNPFNVPPRSATDHGPWGGVLNPAPATAPGGGTSSTTTTGPVQSTTTTGPVRTTTTTGGGTTTTTGVTSTTSGTTTTPATTGTSP